jgi:hypothetical protein
VVKATTWPLYTRERPDACLEVCGKSPPPGFDRRIAQLMASRYTVYGIAVTKLIIIEFIEIKIQNIE